MNYRGSYRHLLRNSRAALLSAIEIYNKPRIDYREECFVILLLNSWELLLKSLLSKNKQSIFYHKKRGESYRTLSLVDALNKCDALFPSSVDPLPVRRNLDLLSTYRDNAVHFYNERGFGTVIYALAQTNIMNYKDILLHSFGVDFGKDVNWALLPLGTTLPVDPLAYISGKSRPDHRASEAVTQFLSALSNSADEVKKAGNDTGRLMTVFSVKLESVKKIDKADVVVGVQKGMEQSGLITIVRTVDPNVTHPLRRKEVLAEVPEVAGIKFTPHVFDAVAYKLNLKSDLKYCWKATVGVLTKYSHETVTRVKQLNKSDIETALSDYRAYIKQKSSHN